MFQYSGGVAANPGYEIERVRFDKMAAAGRRLCADRKIHSGGGQAADVVLRLRAALAGRLHRRGISQFQPALRQDAGGVGRLSTATTNPVARSNVCPEIDPPAEPSFYAFSFTRPSQGTTPSFVIAGGGELQEGNASYAERTVRYRDISPEGIAEKVRLRRRRDGAAHGRVRVRLEGRDGGADLHRARFPSTSLPMNWFAAAPRGPGLTWHFARPPVIDLEYEMDCRRVMREVVI